MGFWDAVATLPTWHIVFLLVALGVALLFEFINGFHDTSNAVTTVIYTRSLKPTPAVIYSGFLNFAGVLAGGTGVAFGIVNLLPVDLLIEGSSHVALVMVLSLLVAGVIWNLGTWYLGLPVSSSHTLIGSIVGVGLANSLLNGQSVTGVNWEQVGKVLLALIVSPAIGFAGAAVLLLVMKRLVRDPRLYQPPAHADDRPPSWIRGTLIATCGGVSFAHGSNDGQKGMGLVLLVLIGFMPAHYAVNMARPELAAEVRQSAVHIREQLSAGGRTLDPEVGADLDRVVRALDGVSSFADLPDDRKWEVRQSIFQFRKHLDTARVPESVRAEIAYHREAFQHSIEYVPYWVVFAVAVALGVGTTVGYKRIVVTVAEKIGKTHLTYGQGAAAEAVAAGTILLADGFHLPVSTTHVLSGGIAGTMTANQSGLQGGTVKRIVVAWVLTLPAAMALSGLLFAVGRWLVI